MIARLDLELVRLVFEVTQLLGEGLDLEPIALWRAGLVVAPQLLFDAEFTGLDGRRSS